MTSDLRAPPAPQRAYTQVLRTGAVEAAASSLADQEERLLLPQIETVIVHYARIYAASLHALGVQPPLAILVSLLNVKGMRLMQVIPNVVFWAREPFTPTLPVDQFHFVETIFETVPADDTDAAKQLRPTLDHLANAAGLACVFPEL